MKDHPVMTYPMVPKKCPGYKKNPDCEGEFHVHVRAAKNKKYCDKCAKKKHQEYLKHYQARRRKALAEKMKLEKYGTVNL